MEALIFAAGLGTRLGSLTQAVPKALVPVGGVPVLERVARRLVDAGVDRIVINTHHFHERIVQFVASREAFGVDVRFSHEPDKPLETGGGLKQAAALFGQDAPIFLHNADIVSDIPLRDLYDRHTASMPLATLAVMERNSSRYLLFDDLGLFGYANEKTGLKLEVRDPRGGVRKLGFSGVHVVTPTIFGLIEESGVFSIFDPYMRLARAGHRIEPFRVDAWDWIDIGKPERLADANRRFSGEETPG